MKEINGRKSEYEVDDLFLKRHSPRAMSGEPISQDELMTLFEAARFAPSSRNSQPWRFIYSKKGTEEFEKFLSFLVEGNKVWCVNASVLVVVIAKKSFDDGRPSHTYSLEAGSAWENLALQATIMDLVAHGMEGFDYALAKEKLSVPEDYAVEMMIAVGKPGKVEDLPDKLREREKSSQRKNLEEIIFEGEFKL